MGEPRYTDFFQSAARRHWIHLRRDVAGESGPWTDDPIYREFRFCNVYRELDTTTIWFRKHVRELLSRGYSRNRDIILGTILFRTFNRIETGQLILGGDAATLGTGWGWDYLRGEMDVAELERRIRYAMPDGPYVTGSYIVKTPDGMDKLSGALWIIEEARKRLDAADLAPRGKHDPLPSLQASHAALKAFPYFGGFTAYEVVSDLRHTPALDDATDVGRVGGEHVAWAHAGPGALRGLNRVWGRDKNAPLSQDAALQGMRLILIKSREYWPSMTMDAPAWEMREVEHWLCEFDKYERVRLGEGKPRQRFRG